MEARAKHSFLTHTTGMRDNVRSRSVGELTAGWDFRAFQKRGRQNLVRKRASLWPGFVRNLKLVLVPGFAAGHPNLRGSLSLDLPRGTQVAGLGGLNYRLLKDNLDKNIVPDKSKFTVKADRVTIKLKKVVARPLYPLLALFILHVKADRVTIKLKKVVAASLLYPSSTSSLSPLFSSD